MSYDLQLGVKVEGGDNLFVTVATPERDNPTYNLRDMFVACMDWGYRQGEWYSVPDVLPKIQHGINELKFNGAAYKKYNATNGWGTVESALLHLESLEKCIQETCVEGGKWGEIPMKLLYMRW